MVRPGGGGKGKGQQGGLKVKQDPRAAKKAGQRGVLQKGPKPWTYPEYRSYLQRVLQPRRSHYGGMGVAKESAFFDITDPELFPKVAQVYEEHIEGFSGKSYKKRKSDVDKNMLWRKHLEEKKKEKKKGEQQQQQQAGRGGGKGGGAVTAGFGGGSSSTAAEAGGKLGLGNRQHGRKKKASPEDAEREKLIEAYRIMKANQAQQRARKQGAFGKL